MKKLTYITLLGLALISLSACNTPTNSNKNTKTENSTKKLNNSTNQQAHTTKENKVEEQKEIDAKPATKTTEQTAAPNINITNNDGANTKNNLVDTIKTKNRKQYVEYFNSTNETSVNGMKDIEELVNDQSKDFDVTIIVAPGINREKTKEEFIEWFNQQEHHNFPVTFTDEATLKNYNITTNSPKPIYIDSNGNLNQSSRGINARATNEAIKSYMANNVQ